MSILTRLTIWLAGRLGLVLMPADRIHGGGDAVERGQRWEAFYREAGGLADMIAGLRKSYFEAASGIGHRDDDKLYEFAVADRMARELDREVLQIVVTGKAEFERRKHAEREQAAQILRAI